MYSRTVRGCNRSSSAVDLLHKKLTIQKSKIEAGERVIPLNADAWRTIVMLYQRARKLGEIRPEHYVFFACEASHFDPNRPQVSWRTAWRKLTRLIHCPACGHQQDPGEFCVNPRCKGDIKNVESALAGLRFHDLRHHAITELAESQTSDSTIMAIAGHVSPKMLQHYSHIRLQAKRNALDGICTRRADSISDRDTHKGYVTNHVTNPEPRNKEHLRLLENMVELVGIEPTTSSLRTMRSPS